MNVFICVIILIHFGCSVGSSPPIPDKDKQPLQRVLQSEEGGDGRSRKCGFCGQRCSQRESEIPGALLSLSLR